MRASKAQEEQVAVVTPRPIMPSLINFFLGDARAGLRIRTRWWFDLCLFWNFFFTFGGQLRGGMAERWRDAFLTFGIGGRGGGGGGGENNEWWAQFPISCVEREFLLVVGGGLTHDSGNGSRNAIVSFWNHHCCDQIDESKQGEKKC